ncbi:MAG: FHA domain-containing protein [Chloroflexi bacterium]|nr:FHA domain-containing protein [Chloroflexota bacterium]
MRKFLALVFVLSLLFAPADLSARAQGQAAAELYPPDISAFPAVSALLDVFDANRIFASGLKPEAVTVIEDGQPVPVTSLNELAVPLQLVVAVNQGASLDARDTAGFSRFNRVAQVLAGWAQTRPADLPDDFSLVSQGGPEITHSAAADFIVGLNNFQPDFRAATPNLQSLNIAIQIVSEQTPRLGMKRAILLITPHMDDPNIASAIQPFIEQANERGIRVFVWFVDLDAFFATTSAAAFNTLAMETGGSMFGYSGLERFPDPEAYFAPLRRVYALSYDSRLTTGGEHTISVQASLSSGPVTSAEQTISLEVQPPNPILVTPPMQITRRAPEDDPFNTEILLPAEQVIEIITEFPDQHKRQLVRTTLYVDGQIADENTEEPFDQFTWDLTVYTTSGVHHVVVEAVDSLGLSKTSMSIPVTVTVIQPPRGPAAWLAKYRQEITIGAIAIAGLVLLTMLLSGRVRIPSLRARREARRTNEDPLTQPIQAVQEIPAPIAVEEKPKRRSSIKPKKTASAAGPKPVNAPASFIRLTADGQPATSNPITIVEKEVTFGTDPVQCTQVLDDPSLSPLHARLRQTDDGGYLLFDNNSIAGTWVNYEPVPREGYRLAQSDVVNFGQLIYRFTLRTPPTTPKPKVTVQKA